MNTRTYKAVAFCVFFLGCGSSSRIPPKLSEAEGLGKTLKEERTLAKETTLRGDDYLREARSLLAAGDSVGAELLASAAEAEYLRAIDLTALSKGTSRFASGEAESVEKSAELQGTSQKLRSVELEIAELDRRLVTAKDKLRYFQKDQPVTKEQESARILSARTVLREADIFCAMAKHLGAEPKTASAVVSTRKEFERAAQSPFSGAKKGETPGGLVLEHAYRARTGCLSDLEAAKQTHSKETGTAFDTLHKQLSELRSKKSPEEQRRWLLARDERGIVVTLLDPFSGDGLKSVPTLEELALISKNQSNLSLFAILHESGKADASRRSARAEAIGKGIGMAPSAVYLAEDDLPRFDVTGEMKSLNSRVEVVFSPHR